MSFLRSFITVWPFAVSFYYVSIHIFMRPLSWILKNVRKREKQRERERWKGRGRSFGRDCKQFQSHIFWHRIRCYQMWPIFLTFTAEVRRINQISLVKLVNKSLCAEWITFTAHLFSVPRSVGFIHIFELINVHNFLVQ